MPPFCSWYWSVVETLCLRLKVFGREGQAKKKTFPFYRHMILLSSLECQNDLAPTLSRGKLLSKFSRKYKNSLLRFWWPGFCAEQFDTVSYKENEGNIEFGKVAKDKVWQDLNVLNWPKWTKLILQSHINTSKTAHTITNTLDKSLLCSPTSVNSKRKIVQVTWYTKQV